MSTITTYTRKHFDPVHPDPGLLCVEDFAHALPMICRGNGHVTTFWSVGEHCICCAKEAAARGYSRRLVLACLLHDASECYMSDVPRPLKQEMPRYREIEDHLLSVIYEKYLGSDLTAEEQRMMKQIDNDLLCKDTCRNSLLFQNLCCLYCRANHLATCNDCNIRSFLYLQGHTVIIYLLFYHYI